MMGSLALWFSRQIQLPSWLLLAFVWLGFIGILYTTSGMIGPEIAGASAALSVLFVGFLIAKFKRPIPTWPYSIWPYLALLLSIIFFQSRTFLTDSSTSIQVKDTIVTWKPLETPGLALLTVLALIFLCNRSTELTNNLSSAWLKRSWKPLTTIFFFLLMSQGLLKEGVLVGLQTILSRLPSDILPVISASLAGLSGYLTGSNIGGNAIFMPTIKGLLEINLLLFSAIQNSGAGHGALGSLPILALIIGLAKADAKEEHSLIRYGFIVVCLSTDLLAILGVILNTFF